MKKKLHNNTEVKTDNSGKTQFTQLLPKKSYLSNYSVYYAKNNSIPKQKTFINKTSEIYHSL